MGQAAGLDAAEVAAIREDAEELLQGTGRVLTLSGEQSGGGGERETWTPGPDIACRIAPYSASRTSAGAGSAGDQVDERDKAFITVPVGTEVTTDDRIEVDGSGVYEVRAIHPRTFDQFVQRIEVKEVP